MEDRQWLCGDGQIKSAVAERVIEQCSTLKGGSVLERLNAPPQSLSFFEEGIKYNEYG
jgi:hypothetical protein